MINLKIFDKKSPDSGKYRSCVKSAEVLARIDNALINDVDEIELKEIERLIKTSSLVFPAPYLMNAIFNQSSKPVIKSETPNVTPTPTPASEPESEPESKPESIELVGEGIPEETIVPTGSETPTEEPVNEEKTEEPIPSEETIVPTETETPSEEPVNEEKTEEQIPAETKQPKTRKGGRKKAEAAE